MYKILNPTQQIEYRNWALENFKRISNHTPSIVAFPTIDIAWHPVIKDECYRIIIEYMVDNEVIDSSLLAMIQCRNDNEIILRKFVTNFIPTGHKPKPIPNGTEQEFDDHTSSYSLEES